MAYTNMVGQFVYETPVLRNYFDQLAENDATLKSNGWQDSVKVVFYQASVPVGWTQDVSANDKFLRVVNNAGGNPGGAVGGSLAVSAGLTLAHTHTTFSTEANHQHTSIGSHQHNMQQADFGNFGSVERVTGIGNVFASFAGANAADVDTQWLKYFNSTVNEFDPSSSDGTHNHTVNSSLANTIPHYADVIVGIKSTSSGYTDLTAFFNHNDRVRYEPFNNAGGLWFNDVFNEARLTPAGTVSLFYNAAAPAGWNKLTTQNDRALRIVSGAGGGVGGNLGAGQTIVLAHANSIVAAGGHSHTLSGHRHDVASGPVSNLNSSSYFHVVLDGSNYLRPTNNDGTTQTKIKGRTTKSGGGTSSTDAAHVHTIGSALTNIILAYVDIIQCQKLSTGAPYAYTSLLGLVVYKKLVTKQRLDSFAKNDEYLRYHTTPAGSIMAFYQSGIPLNWTLLNAQHDKVLRIVSGAGGGSGGNHLISNTITLQHTHTIANYTHSHRNPTHSHPYDTASGAAGTIVAVGYVGTFNSSQTFIGYGNISAFGVGRAIKNPTDSVSEFSVNTNNHSHNHGGVTSSALSNVTFAYANVILCQKN